MPLPLVPIAISLLAGSAYVAQSRRVKVPPSPKVQAERAVIYEMLLNDIKDPDTLRQFSEAFRAEGCIPEADMLLKRAMLRELPDEVKKQRNDAYKKGMASKDPVAINALADAFEQTGATGAAASLRDYAFALQRIPKSNPGIETPSPANEDEAVNGT